MRQYQIQFGKVTYERGAPKNLPRWVWRCACGCGAMNGPFKTLRAAEKDAEETVVRAAEIADATEDARGAELH